MAVFHESDHWNDKKFWTVGTSRLIPSSDDSSFSNSPAPRPIFAYQAPPRYSSMANLRDLGVPPPMGHDSDDKSSSTTKKDNSPPIKRHNTPRRYKRTRSFDDTSLTTDRLPSAAVPYQHQPMTIYPSYHPPMFYHYGSLAAVPYGGCQKLGEEHTVFRKLGSDYCANSYLGWHQPPRFAPSVAAAPTEVPSWPGSGGEKGRYGSAWSLSNTRHAMNGFDTQQTPNTFVQPPGESSQSASFDGYAQPRTSKWKLGLILGILIIIVAVLIAMGVAVYSQVKTHSSVIKLVRQYRGQFVVSGGNLLDFKPELLNSDSPEFTQKAKVFQYKIDNLFQYSGLEAIFEGSEITQFKFLISQPAMEVHFNLKTKVNVSVQTIDLLSVLDDGVRNNVGGLFDDVKIDLDSLTLENERLPPYVTSRPRTS